MRPAGTSEPVSTHPQQPCVFPPARAAPRLPSPLTPAFLQYIVCFLSPLVVVSFFSEGPSGHASYLKQVLTDQKVDQVFFVGLSTDKGIQFSALDAALLLPDAEVFVIEDCCRGSSQSAVSEALRKVRCYVCACLDFARVILGFLFVFVHFSQTTPSNACGCVLYRTG